MKIKLLDTFAGVGGFHLALEQSIGKENVECIGFSEIDKFAKQVYQKHFPNTPDLGDITKIDIENLPYFDLLTGGFPCQDVSVAGKQNLEEGGRTILVEYLLQILEIKQPSYFIFENVKGLMSKKFDKFRESIFERIKNSGYILNVKVLNTKDFGLPQNRDRVFMVGYKNSVDEGFSFPKGKELTTFLKDILEKEVDEKYNLSEKNLKHLQREFGSKGKNVTGQDIIGTLTANMGTGGGNVPYLYNHYNKRLMKNVSGTLSTSMGFTAKQGLTVLPEMRKITPTECARLQGFPDGWSTDYVSNSQSYKQMGNAISVPVVKAMFNNLLNN